MTTREDHDPDLGSLEFDLDELRRDYDAWATQAAFVKILLLVSAVASGITLRVEGEEVARADLMSLVPWEPETEDDELDIEFPAHQGRLTPRLVAVDVPAAVDLKDSEDGVSFDPLLDLLVPRVPTILSAAEDLMDKRARLLRRYPRAFHEEPSLLFF